MKYTVTVSTPNGRVSMPIVAVDDQMARVKAITLARSYDCEGATLTPEAGGPAEMIDASVPIAPPENATEDQILRRALEAIRKIDPTFGG